MKKLTKTLITLMAMLVLTGPATAVEEGTNANSLAVSDAVRSSAVGPTALNFNPAAMHQFIQYAVETGYQFLNTSEGHVFTAAAVDSATNESLAAGFSYSYLKGQTPTDLDRKGYQIRGGLASGYRGHGFSAHVGAGLRYMDINVDDEKTDGLTLDVGALVVLNNIVRLAVVGHNLLESDLTEAPRRFGMATSLLLNSFILSFDAVLDFETLDKTKVQYNVGAEYAVGGRIPLRVGFQADRITDQQYISGGMGYVSRTVAADFGFRQNLDNQKDHIFSFNLRFFIP